MFISIEPVCPICKGDCSLESDVETIYKICRSGHYRARYDRFSKFILTEIIFGKMQLSVKVERYPTMKTTLLLKFKVIKRIERAVSLEEAQKFLETYSTFI